MFGFLTCYTGMLYFKVTLIWKVFIFAAYENEITLVCLVRTSNLYVTLIREDDNDCRISLGHDWMVVETGILKQGLFIF